MSYLHAVTRSKISVDKLEVGEIGHALCYLYTELHQLLHCWTLCTHIDRHMLRLFICQAQEGHK